MTRENEATTNAPKKLCPACHLHIPAVAETCTTIGCRHTFSQTPLIVQQQLPHDQRAFSAAA